MVEIPDLARDLARILGLDKAAATVAVRLAQRPVRNHKTAETAYQTLAAALGVDEDRARSVLFTVESVLRHWGFSNPNSLFVYTGPVDYHTRPFCFEHVGRVYTLTQIRTLDNGQLPDVLVTCGGGQALVFCS